MNKVAKRSKGKAYWPSHVSGHTEQRTYLVAMIATNWPKVKGKAVSVVGCL